MTNDHVTCHNSIKLNVPWAFRNTCTSSTPQRHPVCRNFSALAAVAPNLWLLDPDGSNSPDAEPDITGQMTNCKGMEWNSLAAIMQGRPWATSIKCCIESAFKKVIFEASLTPASTLAFAVKTQPPHFESQQTYARGCGDKKNFWQGREAPDLILTFIWLALIF